MIRKTVGKHPQDSYAAVVRAIQSEWIFLQRATWDIGDAFTGLEKRFRKYFCLVFSSERKTLSPIVGTLSTMSIKMAGLDLLSSGTSAKNKYLSYQQGSKELIRAVTGGRGILQCRPPTYARGIKE